MKDALQAMQHPGCLIPFIVLDAASFVADVVQILLLILHRFRRDNRWRTKTSPISQGSPDSIQATPKVVTST